MQFDASQVDPNSQFDLIPPGEYVFIIRKTDIKPTKAQTGAYLEYEAEAAQGDVAGRKVWGRMNIQNPNPQAEQIGQRELSQLCHAVGVLQVQDTTQLHDKPFIGRVGVEKDKSGQYDDKSVIKQFKPMAAAAPAVGVAAPIPAAQPQPAAPVNVAPAAPAAVAPAAPVAPAVGIPAAAPDAPAAPAPGTPPAWAQ
jgi:hypothetical protein